MSLQQHLIFFFSFLGSFNAILLSLYFATIAKGNKCANNYLSLLLLVLNFRLSKSVFFHFNAHLSDTMTQVGLSALLIGPFLYLYIRTLTGKKTTWPIHVAPFLVSLAAVAVTYISLPQSTLWHEYFYYLIYAHWLIYILLSGIEIRDSLTKLINPQEKLNKNEVWMVSIYMGVLVVWLAYFIGTHISPIAGALSFSFVLYLSGLLWVLEKNRKSPLPHSKEKYENKKIQEEKIEELKEKIALIGEKKLFKNPEAKLADIAEALNVLPHTLSQYLNDNLGTSFSSFINEYRVEEAKHLLLSNETYTIEAIGYESGFNSKSAFFSSFKKITHLTPSQYRSTHKK